MKTRNLKLLAAFAAAAALAPTAQAVTYTAESGLWADNNNWDAAYPNAAGAVATFPAGTPGTDTAVTINSTVTVGQLIISSTNDSSWLTSMTGTGKLIWDNNGSGAVFDGTARYYPDTNDWSVDMQLDDDLTMSVNTQSPRTLASTISGTGHLTLNFKGNHQYYSIIGSSANTYSGGTTVDTSALGSWQTQPLFYLSKDGALGTGDVTLLATSIANNHAPGSSKMTITSSGGDEDRIDDSAMLILNYDATGGYTVVTLDTGVEETVGGLTLDGTVMPDGTYNATTHPDWFAGDGDLIVVGATPAADPEITSITSLGSGNFELTLKGGPSTSYEFYSSATLDFTSGGTLVPLTGGGTDVTTDVSGDATVQMSLTGDANFVRAQ